MTDRPPAGQQRREDKRLEPHDHDPYMAHAKPPDPSVCAECGAAFADGRWSWRPQPGNAATVTCPACRRIADDYPAGTVELSGRFLRDHRQEIEATLRHAADNETRGHPMNRLMDLRWQRGRLIARTTDLHSARRIGAAVRAAFAGELTVDYAPAEARVRVSWHRDA